MATPLEFKRTVILAFIAHFEKEVNGLVESAKSAHEAATHEESRAEDRHDTFAIEQSYLAQGQAVRVQTLRKSSVELNSLLEGLNAHPKQAEVGTLITLMTQGKRSYSLVANFGGGTQVLVDGKLISLLSPTSPLGDALLGLSAGDTFTLEAKTGSREGEVLEVN
jgi:transcription elongation GreA/GreB family factor